MNPRINYTLVGGFVVLLTLVGLFLVGWLTQDRTNKSRVPYLTYFNNSVSGLNEQAAVKYKGVPVGYVEKISLVADPEERVELRLRLDSSLTLRSNSYALLRYQGITGLLFVELETLDQPGTPLVTSEQIPAVIASQGSRLVAMTENLDTAVQNFNQLTVSLHQLSEQLGRLTGVPAQQQLSSLMASLESLSQTAEQRLQALDPQVYQQLATQLGQQSLRMEQALVTELHNLSHKLQGLGQDAQASTRLLAPLLQQTQELVEQLSMEGRSWLRGNFTYPAGPGEQPKRD